MNQKQLWKCPKCGQTFVTKNLWHSCLTQTIESFFNGHPKSFTLYKSLVNFVKEIGPFKVNVNKTRISFQGRVRFAGVPRIIRDGIIGGFWLKRKINSPRFTKVEFIPPNNYVYQFRIRKKGDLDKEVASWIKEAYLVGQQINP